MGQTEEPIMFEDNYELLLSMLTRTNDYSNYFTTDWPVTFNNMFD